MNQRTDRALTAPVAQQNPGRSHGATSQLDGRGEGVRACAGSGDPAPHHSACKYIPTLLVPSFVLLDTKGKHPAVPRVRVPVSLETAPGGEAVVGQR